MSQTRLVLCLVLLSFVAIGAFAARVPVWGNHGGNPLNTRYVATDRKMNSQVASQAIVKWKHTGSDNYFTTPAIEGNFMYMLGGDGSVLCKHIVTGHVVWETDFSDYTGRPNDTARATPVIYKNSLLLGSQGFGSSPADYGAWLVSVDKRNGAFEWKERVDEHPAAVITQSGTVVDDDFFVGVSSLEEVVASDPNYVCCSFGGSMLRVKAYSGEIMWKTPMLGNLAIGPDDYSGNAVWGSSPAIDPNRDNVYIATGNNYRRPQSVIDCENLEPDDDNTECIMPDNYFDAVLAFSRSTGVIVWDKKLEGSDAWTVPCFFPGSHPNCPENPGPDYDFGNAPMFVLGDTRADDMVVIGQKSGMAWGLRAESGAFMGNGSFAVLGPGGELGGSLWGGATNGKIAVFGIANSNNLPYTMVPSNEVVTRGAWVGVDIADKEYWRILWTVPVPDTPGNAHAIAPPTIVNDVVIAGSGNDNGVIVILELATGDLLWEYETGSSIYGGFSSDGNGCFYGGTGYKPPFGYKAGNTFFGVCVPSTGSRYSR